MEHGTGEPELDGNRSNDNYKSAIESPSPFRGPVPGSGVFTHLLRRAAGIR